MSNYIHDSPDWPNFTWDVEAIVTKLAAVRHKQGIFLGTVQVLGFKLRVGTVLEALTDDVQKSSEIEGEHLSREQIRSSIARRLGIDTGNLIHADRHVEGVVEMILDATQRYNEPLTADRLFGWRSALFPGGRSGLWTIRVGEWREDEKGRMRVVSGPIGKERVHYEAPPADRLDAEMALFLDWFNGESDLDPVLKAAVAHVWFVMIHPFDDGNGRIGRAIADICLARSEHSPQRYYSLSSQIMQDRNGYYDALQSVGIGNLDITSWIDWFLSCLDRAIEGAEQVVRLVLRNTRFWDNIADIPINERQRLMLTKLLGKFEGNLTAKKWSILAKCSTDTALRDIQDLIGKGIFAGGGAGGRSASYVFNDKFLE